jgi:hypothetical protein
LQFAISTGASESSSPPASPRPSIPHCNPTLLRSVQKCAAGASQRPPPTPGTATSTRRAPSATPQSPTGRSTSPAQGRRQGRLSRRGGPLRRPVRRARRGVDAHAAEDPEGQGQRRRGARRRAGRSRRVEAREAQSPARPLNRKDREGAATRGNGRAGRRRTSQVSRVDAETIERRLRAGKDSRTEFKSARAELTGTLST